VLNQPADSVCGFLVKNFVLDFFQWLFPE
jgi:hypothetical protein